MRQNMKLNYIPALGKAAGSGLRAVHVRSVNLDHTHTHTHTVMMLAVGIKINTSQHPPHCDRRIQTLSPRVLKANRRMNTL